MPIPTLKDQSCEIRKVKSRVATLENGVLSEVRLGTTVLVAGTKDVDDTDITAESTVLFNRYAPGGTLGHLSYAVFPGEGITFTSSSNTDTSSLNYLISY